MSSIFIPDNQSSVFQLEHFCIPRHYEKDVDSILIPHGLVLNRVEKLAQEIIQQHLKRTENSQEKGLVMICILKGGHQFFSDLLGFIKRYNATHAISVPVSLEFCKIRSYMNDQSTGHVDIQMGSESWQQWQVQLKGKHVLIVEDIIDTGRTMTALLKQLEDTVKCASVQVTSLFLKRTHLSCGYVPDYVGFSIPDEFIVGYCLDYNEYFRDLDHVCIISEHGQQHYAVSAD